MDPRLERPACDDVAFPPADPRASACPICASGFISFVRSVKTRRTKRLIPLHYCMDCQSFWCTSGYREDDEQLARDLEWGIGVADRNRKAGEQLLGFLKALGADCRHVLEVGCGIGAVLDVAARSGSRTLGFDVNEKAITYGRRQYGVDLRSELWSRDRTPGDVTLILSISTLEHVEEPRPLLLEMCEAARRSGAGLFISVPLVDHDKWHFMRRADPYEAGSWLFDNDVHVTHFSSKGLETLIDEGGARKKSWLRQGLWHGILAQF